jgi:hypothetical protein
MVNRHPEVYVLAETHWIPLLWERFARTEQPLEAHLGVVDRTFHADGVSTLAPLLEEVRLPRGRFDSLLRSRFGGRGDLRAFHDAVGSTLARRAGKASYAEKTADYGACLGLLHSLWPSLRCVHAIRDGRDSALSMYRHPGFRRMVALAAATWAPIALDARFRAAGGDPDRLLDYLRLWEARVLWILDEVRRLPPDRCLTVRYEDVVREPEVALLRVADFLQLPARGGWVAEACALVRPGRRARDPAITAWLTPHAQETLAGLGYA